MSSKFLDLEQAIAMVSSNCTLALGGMTLYRRPMTFVRGLIKQFIQTGFPNNITLLNFTAGLESDLLVGAGLVTKVRTCYFGLEIFGLAPMFTYFANRGEIEIIEETEASIAFGLRANMAGVGFMPSHAWIGTDLPSLREDVKTVKDPYSGEMLTAFPAIYPDITVIHAIYADEDGNAVIGDNKAIDPELALSTKTVIVTAEKIVPKLDKADLVAPIVSAVVHAPNGARPTSCHPLYPLDGNALLEYVETVSDPESFNAVLNNWLV